VSAAGQLAGPRAVCDATIGNSRKLLIGKAEFSIM